MKYKCIYFLDNNLRALVQRLIYRPQAQAFVLECQLFCSLLYFNLQKVTGFNS